MSRDGRVVNLGSEAIDLLIGQRPPFRLLDRIASVKIEEPSLLGVHEVAADDPVFEGHFPGQPVYPGVLQIEALAQAAGALGTLVDLCAAIPEALDELVDLGRDPRRTAAFRERLAARPQTLSLGGAVSARWLVPVVPGSRLDLRVVLVRRIENTWHFHGEASVGGVRVTTATLSGARLPR